MKIMMKAGLLMTAIVLTGSACKKNSSAGGSNTGGSGNGATAADSVYAPVDPSPPPSIGFFGDSWQAKSFAVPRTTAGAAPPGTATDSLTIDGNNPLIKAAAY